MDISLSDVGPLLDYDGERFVPGADPDSETLHFHRYLALLDIVKDRDVLDIASGEGFGSWFLHKTARSVVGVDIAAKAVDHAARRYGNDRLSFIVGNCSAIPLPDHSVDVVVSFETIEHITDHAGFLAEVRRVLRTDGVFVVSTPDKDGYGASLDIANPFHVKELSQAEFRGLMSSNFSNVAMYDQGLKLVSVLWPQNISSGGIAEKPWLDLTQEIAVSSTVMPNPVFQIAIASNSTLPIIGGILQQFPHAFPISAITGGTGERIVDAVLSQIRTETRSLNLPIDDPAPVGVTSPVEQIMAGINSLMHAKEGALLAEREEIQSQMLAEREEMQSQMLAEIEDLSHYSQEQSELLRLITKENFKPLLRKYHRKRALYKTITALTVGSLKIKMAKKFEKYDRLISQTTDKIEVKKRFSSSVRRLLAAGMPNSVVTDLDATVHVSIIIPVYNQIKYTLDCLRSIMNHKTVYRFEVIVVDDCSSDETEAELRRIPWIRYLRQPQNGGFIESCNAGAIAARGEYVLFLNNDTEVLDGWLDELVQTFTFFPNAGLVGSKLIYPDGTLQEAGGIMWRDGSAWNFGRNQDPMRPEFCYVRKVDYCSGASIMVPRALFDQLGGFDKHFAPAYCEDSDLAMRLRAAGHDVLYQPLSKLLHFEGITSGTDIGSGIKSYQVANSKKLFERWERTLALRPENADDPSNAKDFGVGKRVLVIDSITPEPDQDAGSITCLEIMRAAQTLGYQVTFIPESNYADLPKYTSALQRIGIEALYSPYISDVKSHLVEHGHRYDAIIVYRVETLTRWYKEIRKLAPEAKLVYQTSDLHHLREAREAEISQDADKINQAEKTKSKELDLVRSSDCTIVHSTFEKDYLDGLAPGAQIEVFNWILDPKGTNVEFEKRSGVMFLGGYRHTPNIDAVHYFLDEIWPIVELRIPDAVFYVVGSNLPDNIKVRAANNVIMVGFVDDLRPMMDRCRMSVVPLRYGAGTKGKLAMSLAYGLPAVTTSIGAEGMGLIDGDCVYVADSPQAFADRIVDLYRNQETWKTMSFQSVEYVVEHLSRQAGVEVVRRALENTKD
jgi:O-antigen biosynthesis protein